MLTKTKTLEKIKIESITWFVGLMAVAVVLPHYVHNQFVTGPIVNAVLFVAAVQLGAGNAILIGLFPSVVALVSGLLPAPLAPMIPFIMISNAVMILTFNIIYSSSERGESRSLNINSSRQARTITGYWAGVFGGTLFKYAFLYLTSTIVIGLISNHNIALKAAATMMAWPQIVTAVVGGVIAFGILKIKNNLDANGTR